MTEARSAGAAGRLAAVIFLGLLAGACVVGSPSLRQAQKYAKAGDYDRAVLAYSKALSRDPDNPQIRVELGRARFRASSLHFDKAKKYLAAGRVQLGVEELEAAVMLDPGNDYAAIELEKAKQSLLERRAAEDGLDSIEDLKEKSKATLDAPKLHPASNVPIFLKFKDEELGKIFDALSKASGINLLYDDRVELNKKVTVDQANVTFEQALDLLMIQNKLFYKVHDPSTLIIIPDNRQKRQEYEDQVIKTFYLSNADVKDVQTILRTLLDARKVAVNDQLNAITIKDTPDVVAVAQKLVEGNDKAKAEVIVDTEIIEINRNTFKSLGLDINTSALSLSFQGGEGEGSGQRSLRITDLDAINNQSAYLLGPIPNAILNFLKTDSDTRTIAKPQVRVTEGERAQLNIGQRVPIPTTSFNTSNTVGTGVVPLTSFTYQNVGISVEIEPRVHHNKEVTLIVAVEVSSLAGSIATTGGQSQPIIGTRNINTVIRLKEGESQILAGLIQENDRKSLRTIPGLDKIPIIRSIFGTNERTRDRTDIVLALTPRIVRLPDIRDTDLEAMWVGTSQNVFLRGAESSPFGAGPFDGDVDGEGDDFGGDDGSGGPGFGIGGDSDGGDEPADVDDNTGEFDPADDLPADDEPEPDPAVILSMFPLGPAVVGQTVDVAVRIFEGRNVVSTPFNLRFDPSHLQYVPEGAVQGPFLGSQGGNVSFLGTVSPGEPNVVKVGLSLLGANEGVDGNGDLCILRFRVLPKAIEAGTTSIVPFGNIVFSPGLQQLPTIFPALTLEVQP